MIALPAYEGITLALGEHAVRLRPSLRAAHRLPSPPDLIRHVSELHTGAIREIVLASAIDEKDAEAFLEKIDVTPLTIVAALISAPLFALLGALAPATEQTAQPDPSARAMPWHDVVGTLYRRATGWLGWTPEQAWNATPTEISEALAGWIEMQEALNPPAEGKGSRTSDAYTPERIRQIEEQGFDPAFDRSGLQALKSMQSVR